MNEFIKAHPIYAKNYGEEKNISLYFTLDFLSSEADELVLTAHNFYRIYLNGKFLGYGPARSAHHHARVDSYKLRNLPTYNRLVIEVYGANCNSYYAISGMPFLMCELHNKGQVSYWTGRDFKCFLNSSRYQKVVRFSYQRAFSESYKLNSANQEFLKNANDSFKEVEIEVVNTPILLNRVVHYPRYINHKFTLQESGRTIKTKNNVYDDRYMHLEGLKIFSLDELEIDPNYDVSLLGYRRYSHLNKRLNALEFSTYAYKRSLSGFIFLRVKVHKKCRIYITFDEINQSKNPHKISFNFYRNTSHNIISYDLEEGDYDLLSFEPYTAKYIRVIVISGEVEVKNIGIKTYENPDAHKLKIQINNKKIMQIIEAARATFAQNSLDLLSDCPSRERAGWLFDSYFSAQAEQIFTGENIVEKAFLENYLNCKKDDIPEGMVPMCYPADFFDGNFIPNWAMWYILELENYYHRTGDFELVNKSQKNVEGILKYFQRYENCDGLLANLDGWVFVEWSKANDPDHIIGVNYPSNMLYYAVLESYARLYNCEEMHQKALKIKEYILTHALEDGFFVDNAVNKDGKLVSSHLFCETTQYYAFYFKIVTSETHKQLFETLIKDFGAKRDDKSCFPHILPSNVLPGDILRLSILNEQGLNELTLREVIDYFYKMSKLTGTLWEHNSPFASLNHGFTSYITNLLINAIFGLRSIDNSKKIITISNKYLNINAKVVVPLKKGNLTITIKNHKRYVKGASKYQIIYTK